MDTIAMDTYPFVAGSADQGRGHDPSGGGAFRRPPAGQHVAEAGYAPRRGQANDAEKAHLRTSIRRAIITLIAHLSATEITPEIPPPETRP